MRIFDFFVFLTQIKLSKEAKKNLMIKTTIFLGNFQNFDVFEFSSIRTTQMTKEKPKLSIPHTLKEHYPQCGAIIKQKK